MSYVYINREIYPNQLVQDDPLDDNYAKGYSYDDYINGNPAPWIELGEEQLAFKEANPKATVKEDTNILYEVIQSHTLSAEWEPGLNTASLYKVIDKEHAGTIGDPIPYFPPMEIFKDKYYIQNADVYKCTRDSGTPLSHNLQDLIGLYVERV